MSGPLATLSRLAVPIDGLRPYAANPRNGDIDAIAESLTYHGQYRPIVVRQGTNEILAGNHTYMAAMQLGWKELAVTFVDVDDEEAARIVIVDNRLNDRAKNDDGLLAELLQGLPDLAGTGYDDTSLAELLGRIAPPLVGHTDPDDVPALPETAVTQPGDLWLLGEHRLLCGDAMSTHLDGDVVVTDPPYGMALDTDWTAVKGSIASTIHLNGGNRYRPVEGDDRDYDPRPLMAAYADIPEQFWFGADYYAERIPERNAGSFLVWDKRVEESADPMVGSAFELCWSRKHHKREIIRVKWAGIYGLDTRRRLHPTQKPVALLEWLIERYSKPGATVLDFYGGSGTTLIAAQRTERTASLVEIDPLYCDVICRRYQEHTGVVPVLESTGEPRDFTS